MFGWQESEGKGDLFSIFCVGNDVKNLVFERGLGKVGEEGQDNGGFR